MRDITDLLNDLSERLEVDSEVLEDMVSDAAGGLWELWSDEPLDGDDTKLLWELFTCYLNEENGNG